MRYKVAYHCQSIYSIDLNYLASLNVKYLICDLDNTLDDRHVLVPSKRAFLLKEELKKLNIELIVISNNRKCRVEPYAKALGVRYLNGALKYVGNKVGRYLKRENIPVEECLFAGDQIYSDRLYINRLHGRMLLTEPLSDNDNFYTRIIRIFDKKTRRKWLKKGLLGEEFPSKATPES